MRVCGVRNRGEPAPCALPEAAEKEPNNSPGDGEPVPLPATFTGALGQVGDVDHFRFRAEAGQELVFRVTASQVRSRLNAVLTLLDSQGRELAEALSIRAIWSGSHDLQ